MTLSANYRRIQGLPVCQIFWLPILSQEQVNFVRTFMEPIGAINCEKLCKKTKSSHGRIVRDQRRRRGWRFRRGPGKFVISSCLAPTPNPVWKKFSPHYYVSHGPGLGNSGGSGPPDPHGQLHCCQGLLKVNTAIPPTPYSAQSQQCNSGWRHHLY